VALSELKEIALPELKLAKLPDRQPVKIAFRASPELAQMLRDYAIAYRGAYGEEEPIEELVPFILTAFLESDRGFVKARKDNPLSSPKAKADTVPVPRRRRRVVSESSSQTLTEEVTR
jgi:hypothetical protein